MPEDPFPSYLDKQQQINAAWGVCEERFVRLPAPIDELGRRFLQAISSDSGSHRSYFSNPLAPPLLYMPLWFFDGIFRDRDESAKADASAPMISILAGTILGYMGIRIQDDVIDERGRTDPQMLLFGNTCFSGMIAEFSKALGTSSAPFWTMFDRDFVDFSRHTFAEQAAVSQNEPYSRETFEEHAEKVAFARTPLFAVATLVGRLDVEPLIRTLVHRLGIAYGIVNDIVGWPRDLRAGHRTWLLASANLSQSDLVETLAIQDKSIRDVALLKLEERLRQSLYEGGNIRNALQRSIEMQRLAAESATSLGLEGFDRYTRDRMTWLATLERQTSLITLARVLDTNQSRKL